VLLNWAYHLFPPRDVQSILLNLMLPIGDTLFATPTVRALRQRFPQAHIAALVFATNAGVLYANEDIDEVILHPTRQSFSPLAYLRFLRAMWRRRFTLAVEFRPYVWWLSLLCGVWRRLSLDIPLYQWVIPLGARPWKHRHAISSYATVPRMLGLRIDGSRLIVRTTEADRAWVASLLSTQGIRPHDRVIALHPGGEGFRGMKRWEAARFSALGDRLARRYGARIVIVGGHDELALARDVAAGMREPAVVLNGHVSLSQTVAVLERCYLFVGNDSAPLHMAGSLGIATVGIFGPTSLVNYRPVGPHVEVACSGVACSPCFHFVGSHPLWAGSRCQVPTCLHALAVTSVLHAAERALARKGDAIGP
jgi:ADP-heptose:LPS heptosyltransferase